MQLIVNYIKAMTWEEKGLMDKVGIPIFNV